MIEHFWAVVPAGGAGTRLWPLSRQGSPKFLHDLTGSGRTLIQATYDRLAPLADDRIVVITGQAHRDAVVAQLPELGADAVIAEPSARDSMAAIGLAAALLEVPRPGRGHGLLRRRPRHRRHRRLPRGRGHRRGGRPRGLAGDDRHRAHPPRDRLRLHPRRRCPRRRSRARSRSASSSRSRPRRSPRRTSKRATAGTPACSSPDPACCSTSSPSRTRASPPRCGASPPTRRRSTRSGPPCPRSPSTTRWPNRPPLPGSVAVVPGTFGWDDIGDFASLRTLLVGEDPVTVLGDAGLVRHGRRRRPRRRPRRSDGGRRRAERRGGRGHRRRAAGHHARAGPGREIDRGRPQGGRPRRTSREGSTSWLSRRAARASRGRGTAP